MRTLRFHKFGSISKLSDLPLGRTLMVDCDKKETARTIYSILKQFSVLRIIGLTPKVTIYKRTKRGWHIVHLINEKLSDSMTVAVQAILGSDPWREALNAMRVRRITQLKGKYGKFWRKRWNILYDYKLS